MCSVPDPGGANVDVGHPHPNAGGLMCMDCIIRKLNYNVNKLDALLAHLDDLDLADDSSSANGNGNIAEAKALLRKLQRKTNILDVVMFVAAALFVMATLWTKDMMYVAVALFGMITWRTATRSPNYC